MLLTIDTVGGDRRSHVRVHSDAVLIEAIGSDGYTPRYQSTANIRAMSIIGPEQSIRAIAAGCALDNAYARVELRIAGPNRIINAKWAGPWSCRAQALARGVMHMVAIPTVSSLKELAEETLTQVCIGTDDADLRRVLYQRLLLCFPTPLIPLGMPGQPGAETAAAHLWCRHITNHIIGDRALWTPLVGHPDQTDTAWRWAGVLHASVADIDSAVCAMVQSGQLRIPEAA